MLDLPNCIGREGEKNPFFESYCQLSATLQCTFPFAERQAARKL